MIRKFFHTLLVRRHFWRYATFGEIAELYVSRVLRMAAINMISAFVSIYLFQSGYSIAEIAFYWAIFYGLKMVISIPMARLVAWVGPRHATFISNILYIPAMVAYALVPEYGVWLLGIAALFQAVSISMYSISYSVDFSKVKSFEHAGKQIAYMNIFEKITAGLSPIIGGFLAFLWGPQIVIVLSAGLFAFAATPLLRAGEPVKVNQKLVFRGFPWRLLLGQSGSHVAWGFDVFSSGTVWSLFVATIILGVSSTDNGVYAIVGVLTSAVFVAAIFGSYIYGRIIDRKRGRELMYFGVVASSLTHIIRPFVGSPVVVAGLNAASELATTGYTLPYTRATYDNADLSGVRTTYIGMLEMLSNAGAGVAACALGGIALLFGGEQALHAFFFVSAAMILLVFTARFPLYKK